MDKIVNLDWLRELDQQTLVLSPTRGLANMLNEQFAVGKIANQQHVWEAANIFVWPDYLNLLWQVNRSSVGKSIGMRTVISAQQSLLLWTKVIEQSRRQERELTLLNVQQTARAVQRSWRLIHDWRIKPEDIEHDHVADTQQFLQWLNNYTELLAKRGFLDEPMLLRELCELPKLRSPFKKVVWYAYDLVTAAQQKINEILTTSGTTIEQGHAHATSQSTQYQSYQDTNSEILQSLLSARKLIEKNADSQINIVIPDLSNRLVEVRELAREVFYAALSPLQVQQNNTVYRFSLGQPLSDWAAIETALSSLKLLRNRCTLTDLSFLLRNQFLGLGSGLSKECRLFDRWLQQQRLHTLMVDNLPKLYGQYLLDNPEQATAPGCALLQESLLKLVDVRLKIQAELNNAKDHNGFAALTFNSWVEHFTDWLSIWGWHTKSADMELNSVQHQLHQRWLALLDEFAGLATVQHQAGLKRALDLLQQMARDAMFLPKSSVSPILISSLLEAIGRPVDACFLTGMNQNFPSPPKSDAFVPTRLLQGSGNPDASPEASYQQAVLVNQSVLSSARNKIISYAMLSEQDREIRHQVSALYREQKFTQFAQQETEHTLTPLVQFQDIAGPPWAEPGRAKGGSRIFENQSNCAFKAFVTHQLGFKQDQEAEFGLDAMDRGNVVHLLLDIVWQQLGSQSVLLDSSEEQLDEIVCAAVEQTLANDSLFFSADKRVLLQRERPRLIRLIKGWLSLEAARPQNFRVIEREVEGLSEIAGIKFKYIIDRVDATDDGQTYIVDYKTGIVNRKDWLGERIKSPQLPLYALARDKAEDKPVAGIAFGKVNQTKHEFVELAGGNVFKRARGASSYEEQWIESRAQWPDIFNSLAEQFLSGYAEVNPVDEDTCRYCELQAVCRVSQLEQEALDGQ
jgi:ATP-dependent helicase/nuclease subunit B